MAEIKDKIITLESLSALHEYNKETFETKENAVNKSGDTMTDNLHVTKAVDDIVYTTTLGINSDNGYTYIAHKTGDTTDNYISLTDKKSYANKPWGINSGGTGSADGSIGLKNLFAAGGTILSSYQYGDKLPAAGTVGRIFFKRLADE